MGISRGAAKTSADDCGEWGDVPISVVTYYEGNNRFGTFCLEYSRTCTCVVSFFEGMRLWEFWVH